MRNAWSILCLLTACNRTPTPDHEEQRTHEQGHEHEDRHDELPRTVALSPQVIADAGVHTSAAQLRALAPTVRLPGEIVAPPDRRAAVAARIDGIVETVHVQPGVAVERGDLLVTVRAPGLQSLRAAEASLRARAGAARANAERVRALVDRRMSSDQEARSAEADAEALEAEARAAKDRLKALGLGRGRGGSVDYQVRATIDGIVLERPAVRGSPVLPDTVVATIVSTDEVWFIAHVFERDVARVKVGSDARVYLNAYPEEGFAGSVEYVSHQVDPGAQTLSARIPLTNADGRLRLGLFGTAHVVVTGEASGPVLAVPNGAITRIAGRPVVFVQHDDGHFEVHDIVVGASDTEFTEVVHGLREGEQVVDEGVFTVKSVLLRGTFSEGHH